MVLQSEVHMDSVLAYMAARERPIIPCGKNIMLIVAYRVLEASPCVRPGTVSGPSHIGVNTISGQTRYSAALKNAERFASLASFTEMKRVASDQVPPL